MRKKLNILSTIICITIMLAMIVGMLSYIIYYKLALIPEYIVSFTDNVRVEDCYIIDENDEEEGYVVYLVYNNHGYSLKGKKNYMRCVNRLNNFVSCELNKAVYRYGNTKLYITKVHETVEN